MKRDLDLQSWAVFCAVAREGSISAACEAAGTDASGVSRIIRGLEASLGVRLFDRSIRPLKLTGNGETALVYARQMLESREALLSSLEPDANAMRGTIRIGFPPQVLQNFLLPFLIDFHRDYPEIYLNVSEYTGSVPVEFDTPQGRLDIVCGYGADPSHPNIVQIHYGNGPIIPCASPLYLSRRGSPGHPSELVRHTGVVFESPMRPMVRFLERDGETAYLRWRDTMTFTSAASAYSATLCGGGIHPGIPALHCYRAISAGELEVVLPGWRAPMQKLYLYARPEAVRHRRAQVLIERYRGYMDGLHRECQRVLAPFIGEVELVAGR